MWPGSGLAGRNRRDYGIEGKFRSGWRDWRTLLGTRNYTKRPQFFLTSVYRTLTSLGLLLYRTFARAPADRTSVPPVLHKAKMPTSVKTARSPFHHQYWLSKGRTTDQQNQAAVDRFPHWKVLTLLLSIIHTETSFEKRWNTKVVKTYNWSIILLKQLIITVNKRGL